MYIKLKTKMKALIVIIFILGIIIAGTENFWIFFAFSIGVFCGLFISKLKEYNVPKKAVHPSYYQEF